MRLLPLFFMLFCADLFSETVPGGLFVWDIPEGAYEVRFKNRPVFVIKNMALVGIPVFEKNSTQVLNYKIDGELKKQTFQVLSKQYTEQHITIKNKALVTPPAQELERIKNESSTQKSLYESHSSPLELTKGFVFPLKGTITSLFGHRRFFNGQPRSPHSGIDIAASKGTPIIAPASGKIVLAQELYFNGETVFIDHGQGLVTMYCHMSRLLVSEGDKVEQGSKIGLVGSTGRATGPHLHWSVSLNGFRVDPNILVQTLNNIIGADRVFYGG